MSLYSLVSRGVTGRLGARSEDAGADDPGAADQADARPSVRLRGASMWVLEASLALTAIATAILIGVGR